jgi:hypothetical protein
MVDFTSVTRHADGSASWRCGSCGEVVTRYRGQGDVECQCGAQYNAFGQRMREDSSNYDVAIVDLDGFATQDADEDWDDEDWDG